MTYTRELEALDRKWGRTVTVHDWHHARTKTAADRTDDDRVILKAFGGERSRGEMASSMADNNRPVSERRLHQAFDEYTDVRSGALTRMYRALEHRSLLKHCGEWAPDKTYPEGRLVTHAGKLWESVLTTNLPPGEPGSGWRLLVKK